MNVIFLTLAYINSINDHLVYTDLLREFIRNGDNVTIVSPIEQSKKKTFIIHEDNCTILKVRIDSIQKTNLVRKGISTLTFEFRYKNEIRKFLYNIKYDLVLYSTPPITLVKAINYIKRRDKAKTYLMLKDIFPQNAVDLGMLKKSGLKGIIYTYFRHKEKQLYSISDYIGCMSEANVDYVLAHNPEISSSIVEVCPNSIEPRESIKNKETIIHTRQQYNIPVDKTVFVYGGNLGKPQGIDFMIECLKANETNQDVYFLIIGSGTEYPKTKKYFDEYKPRNAQLLNLLPRDEYESLVGASDVGLIFLDKRFTIPNFPSRLLTYMEYSLPVLAATDKCTDLGKVIVEGGFGLWCESGDILSFNNNINEINTKVNLLKNGKKSKEYLDSNYSSNNTYKIIISH